MLQAEEKDDLIVKILAFVRSKTADTPDTQEEEADTKSRTDKNGEASSSGSESEPEEGDMRKAYKPHIPGRVLYIYRSLIILWAVALLPYARLYSIMQAETLEIQGKTGFKIAHTIWIIKSRSSSVSGLMRKCIATSSPCHTHCLYLAGEMAPLRQNKKTMSLLLSNSHVRHCAVYGFLTES